MLTPSVVLNNNEYVIWSFTVTLNNSGPADYFINITEPIGATFIENLGAGVYTPGASVYLDDLAANSTVNIVLRYQIPIVPVVPIEFKVDSITGNDTNLLNNVLTDILSGSFVNPVAGAMDTDTNCSCFDLSLEDSECTSCTTEWVIDSTTNGAVLNFDSATGIGFFQHADPTIEGTVTYHIWCNNCADGNDYEVSGPAVRTFPALYSVPTPGAQGSQGADGAQGSQGDAGAQGSQGDIGSQGAQGAQGTQGVAGAQGPQGATGSQGTQGVQGAQGTQGNQGTQGVMGDGIQLAGTVADVGDLPGGASNGDAYLVESNNHLYIWNGVAWFDAGELVGPQGAQGAQGTQGTQGSVGAQGSQGIVGAQGSQGSQGSAGSQGSQGVQGSTGSQGAQGVTGAQGTQGTQGSAGAQGTQGAQGNQGNQGTQGAQGAQGSQGTQGYGGLFGGNSQPYTFSTTTADSDPGTGVLRYNNADPSLVTEIYIDNANADSVTISDWLDVLDDSTNTYKGTLRVVKRSDSAKFADYEITSVADSTGYRTITVTYIVGNSTFANSDPIFITVERAGNVGAQGTQGVQGATGTFGTAQSITSDVSTSYTLVITDAGKLITLDNANPIALNVPTFASVAFATGTRIDILQLGVGSVTVTPAVTVNVDSPAGVLASSVQYTRGLLQKIATNDWVLHWYKTA